MRTFNLARHTRSAGMLLAGLAAGGVLMAGGMAVAADDTATSSPSSSSSSGSSDSSGADARKARGAAETELTGDTAQSVKDAVLAKYPGATFDRIETDSDGVYEAHITKADGSKVTVELDKDFAITGEEAGGGRGGRGGHGGGGGGGKGGPGECDDDAAAPAASADATTAS